MKPLPQRQSFLKTVFLVILVFVFLIPVSHVQAKYDPLSVPNNRFGIHIADPNDISDVAALVNSAAGDWGYVTVVIPQTDQNTQAWQEKFDQMRRLHLIPIVRLATRLDGASWSKPKKEDIRDWVSFLTNLNWPVANRYIVLFNEPNHANEWGNTIDPEGYADILVSYATALKEANQDFFILPAALDASAASDGQSLDEAQFLEREVAARPELLDLVDGWTSHSYPNPGFSGSPYAWGRGSLRTFAWELDFLSQLGLKKELPVFVTETGWVHSEGKFWQPKLLRPEAVGANLQAAASTVWQDPRIAAVTPFVFNYQDYPFDHFSFKQLGNAQFYAHYQAYQQIPKMKGTPRQRESYQISQPLLPDKLVAGSRYDLQSLIINSGQGILDPEDSYQLVIDNGFTLSDVHLPYIEPGQTEKLSFTLTTPKTPGALSISLQIRHHDSSIPLETRQVTIVPPPTLTIRAQLGWRKTKNAEHVKVLVYKDNTIIHEFPNLKLSEGTVDVQGLTNIIPSKTYRVVVVIPYYLPKQRILPLSETMTTVDVGRLLPLDANGDGALTAGDVRMFLQLSPIAVLSRFFGL